MSQSPNRKLILVLRTLLVMIVGLMALGAGVRTMNAGLSCPDWPLCFGKVIPDFHPGVWFEFVHRAYAGLVAIIFAGSCAYVLFSKSVPLGAKRASVAGIFFLFMQIAAGALTVLWKVKAVAVTSHLMLATLFFCSVLWMLLSIDPRVKPAPVPMPAAIKFLTGLFSFAVLAQILMGGIVASTYAGSVCVDWPLCDGQWVPTWTGAIGHQIIHRFMAYSIATGALIFAVWIQVLRDRPWVTRQFLALSRMAAAVVLMQVGIGIANLVLFIPPWVTVLHQSVAILLLATFLRIFHVARLLRAVAPVREPMFAAGLAAQAGGASG